ncbi:hypothetical protein RRG08_061549 [Elysia crispata]|uniref:Uncharacterized protein n=1 Tax=Elysia crispata TaxID=231223 RepID=A0AAE1E2H3_9GAST|nr:hypothetical protein RRG08_061549 [Elysia crispata]
MTSDIPFSHKDTIDYINEKRDLMAQDVTIVELMAVTAIIRFVNRSRTCNNGGRSRIFHALVRRQQNRCFHACGLEKKNCQHAIKQKGFLNFFLYPLTK